MAVHDRARFLMVLALLVYPVAGSSLSGQSQPAFRVLAIHLAADEPGSATANVTWYTTLREVLRSQVNLPSNLFQEYVAADSLGSADTALALRDYLREKYRTQRPDLVIAGVTSIRDFVLRYRDDLFPNAPIVAAGSFPPNESTRRAGAGMAAVRIDGSFRETLELALRLHPATRHVYVLTRPSPNNIPDLRPDLERVAPGVQLTYVAELSVPEMLQLVRALSPESLVLYFNYVQTSSDGSLYEVDIARLVAAASPVPVYGVLEPYMGLGLVGGMVRTPRNEATELGTMAARVLNGERAQDLAIEAVKLTPIFDWRQLRRWSIDESRLPSGSDVRFRELTTWEQYRWLILTTLAVTVLQALMIVGLILQRARRREATAALHQSQKRYALATSAGHVGVWDWEPGTGTVYVDPAVRALLGYPGCDAREQLDDWLQLVHPEDRVAVVDRLQEHVAGQSVLYEVEHRVLHRDGSIHWVLVRGSVASREGLPTRVIGTMMDTTERKRAEQKLQDVQRELARVGRVTALGEFATSIAHEVRQPLTAIISSARASMRFLSNGATTEAQEALSFVLDASKRADAVIERNRELFRSRTVQKEVLDCNALVIEATRMARPRLDSSQVSLATSLAEQLPGIAGDRIELQQVLLNLIVNAIDAMDPLDPASRRLEISTGLSSADSVRVAVRDNGVGLGGVDMQRLFSFSYTTKATGTGVGLAISQSIVEAHGGKLWAEQNVDRGATFSFTIPAASTNAAREALAS